MKKNFRLVVAMLLVVLVVGVSVSFAAPVKVTVWGLLRPNDTDASGLWLVNVIKKFEAANPDIKIDYTYTETESYKTKLQVAMFGNAGPDIFYNWGGESQAVYSRQGLLLDLSKELGKGYWGLSKGLFATHTYNKKIYGVPMWPMVASVWYNKEMFEKNGWKAPKTWDEFLALCEKIKAKGVTPVAMGGRDSWTILQPFMYMSDRLAGAKLYADAKAGKAKFNHPAFVKAFEMLQTLSKKGYLPADVLNMTYGDASQMMMQNTAAMMSMGSWEYTVLTNEFKNDLDKWDFFAFPSVKGGKGDPKAVVGAADGFSVNKACKNQAAAIKFMKYLYSKEALVECNKKTGRLVSLGSPYLEGNTRPQIKATAELLAGASSLTQWWDQDLSASMTQALLQNLQEVVAGVKAPKDAAAALEASRKK